LKAILLTLHYRRCRESLFVNEYFDEFGAKIAQAFILVLGAIAELIKTKIEKSVSLTCPFKGSEWLAKNKASSIRKKLTKNVHILKTYLAAL
jgi:hypothetical protein